jgi:hypothetical protein
MLFGARRAFRTIIPDLQDRIPITWHTAPYPLALYIPFLFMAYLARRKHTYLTRLLLLPITLCGIVAAAYRYVWIIPELNVYNWGQCEHRFVVSSVKLSLRTVSRSPCCGNDSEIFRVRLQRRRYVESWRDPAR